MPGVVDEAVHCSPCSCSLSSHVEQPGAFEQPIQELLLRPVLHSVWTTAQPRQKPSVMHARTPAQLRTLMQRFSAACCSCARSSSALAACA